MANSKVGVLVTAVMGIMLGGLGAHAANAATNKADTYPGPPLHVSSQQLEASLACTPFENPDKPVVLLVHGTSVTGTEEYTLFYTPSLVEHGFDVCAVTYPDRGLGDMQISAEYVVYALRTIHKRTGRKVAMIGHSQGATMPRWALKFWPKARAAVEDFVLIAGPNHGTLIASPARLAEMLFNLPLLKRLPFGLLPASIYQFQPGSKFNKVLNTGDETPGDIDYTTLYGLYDELVRPVVPKPTAALEFGKDNPHVSNILLQDVCGLGYFTEHLTIGTTDPVAFQLALDAITHPGPANAERAGGIELCSLLPLKLSSLITLENLDRVLKVLAEIPRTGVPRLHLTKQEPPLMPYARDVLKQ